MRYSDDGATIHYLLSIQLVSAVLIFCSTGKLTVTTLGPYIAMISEKMSNLVSPIIHP